MPSVDPVRDRLFGPLEPGFGERVESASKAIGDKHQAAEVANLSKDQLNKIIAERAVPNFASIAALARKSGPLLAWLAFGGKISTETSFSENAGDDTVRIRSLDSFSTYPFARVWLRELGLKPDDVNVATMPNNAMEPTIARGDVLLLDIRESVDWKDGTVMALTLGSELAVRRVQIEMDGSVILAGDNPLFKTQRLDRDQAANANILGRVLWRGSSALL